MEFVGSFQKVRVNIMALGRPWTREELMIAINLYCKTPFGRIHNRNPDIIALAEIIDRTPSSVSYKLANFASLDVSLPRKGASNYSKLDYKVWNEFYKDWDELAYQSELLLQNFSKGSSVLKDLVLTDESINIPLESERIVTVKARVNQSFFRKMILASYETTCCVTGISLPELLVASHIVPWVSDTENRLNPRNGLCLNVFHDKAFDQGLITFSDDFELIPSTQLSEKAKDPEIKHLLAYKFKKATLPRRFLPDPAFLQYHRAKIFLG